MIIHNGKYGEHTIKNTFLYKNIFLVGSTLHAGNTIDYFRYRTQNLVVFYFLGTLRNEKDFIQVYEKGKLTKQQELYAPRIPLIYYAFVYAWYIKILITFFQNKDKIYIITFHPLFILFNSIVRLIRNIKIVFWIADVLPKPPSILFVLYQKLIFYYHSRNYINFYLGDKLNKLMNGKLLNSKHSRTVMWGIRLENVRTKKKGDKVMLGFIGVVRKGHGLDLAFRLLQKHKNIRLKILGECDNKLFQYYQNLMKSYDIQNQVEFKNRFYKNIELKTELSTCTVGIGLYNTSKDDPIFYTDPGKIKTYTQFGLPVIMTNTSEIVPYIKKFKAGEITEPNIESLYKKVLLIKNNYQRYLKGVNKFNYYFEYNSYYDNSFKIIRD